MLNLIKLALEVIIIQYILMNKKFRTQMNWYWYNNINVNYKIIYYHLSINQNIVINYYLYY